MARHKLIVYRDDHAGKSQPISFDGDRWREFVSDSSAWTVLWFVNVLPPGSVAVVD